MQLLADLQCDITKDRLPKGQLPPNHQLGPQHDQHSSCLCAWTLSSILRALPANFFVQHTEQRSFSMPALQESIICRAPVCSHKRNFVSYLGSGDLSHHPWNHAWDIPVCCWKEGHLRCLCLWLDCIPPVLASLPLLPHHEGVSYWRACVKSGLLYQWQGSGSLLKVAAPPALIYFSSSAFMQVWKLEEFWNFFSRLFSLCVLQFCT